MAVLAQVILQSAGRGSTRWWARMLAALTGLLLAGPRMPAETEATREYQVKAVFLFNFTRFVDWPAGAFADARTPLIIGVLGDDPFGRFLDETVRGEKSGTHPLLVKRYQTVNEATGCQVLFICQSEAGRLEQDLQSLKGRNILTVGDTEAFAQRGGVVRFITVKGKIRLRINLEAAKVAGLTLSSKLLRPSEIVSEEKAAP